MTITEKINVFLEANSSKLNFINELSLTQLNDVYDKLTSGAPLVSTAQDLIDNVFIDKENNLKGIVGELAKFKLSVLDDAAIIKSQDERGDIDAKVISKRLSQLNKKLDGMGRLGWLIDTQTDRVESLLKIEKKGLPMQTTDTAVKLLGTLLKDYINFQIETKEIDRAPQEHVLRVEAGVNTYLSQTVQNDGDTMAETALRLIDIAKKRTLQLEECEPNCFSCANVAQDELPDIQPVAEEAIKVNG